MEKKLKYGILSTVFAWSFSFANSGKLAEGINYYKLGNYEKAAASFEEVLKTDPTNAAALSNLGFIYYRTGNYQKAKENLTKSLNYIKDRELIALTYYVLADIEKKNNNEDGYYKNLTQAVSYNPDFSDAISELLEGLYSKGDFEKIASLNINVRKLPEKQQLIMAESYIKTGKNTKDAISILEKLKNSQNSSISSKASQLLASVRDEKVARQTKQIIENIEKPQTARQVQSTAMSQPKVKDISVDSQPKITKTLPVKKIAENDENISKSQVGMDSEAEILRKLKENPSVELFNKAGLVYLKQGKTEDAKTSFLNALKLDPFNTESLNNLGILYFNLKDYDKAIKFFSDAVKRDNSFTEGYYNLGNTYYQLGELYKNISYFKNAIENYRKVVSLNPGHKSAYYNMGNAYFMIEDYKSAIENYQKADTTNSKVRKNIAISYYNLATMEDHRDSAIEYLKNAIGYDNTLKEAYYLLGKILYERGDYKEAKTYLKEAYNLYSISEKAEIVYLLGLAYSYSGDKDTAIKYYKELRGLDQALADKLFETLFQ